MAVTKCCIGLLDLIGDGSNLRLMWGDWTNIPFFVFAMSVSLLTQYELAQRPCDKPAARSQSEALGVSALEPVAAVARSPGNNKSHGGFFEGPDSAKEIPRFLRTDCVLILI